MLVSCGSRLLELVLAGYRLLRLAHSVLRHSDELLSSTPFSPRDLSQDRGVPLPNISSKVENRDMQTSTIDRDFEAAIAALAAVPTDVARYRELDDTQLLELARLVAIERQFGDTHSSLIAGEIERRSAPELGSAGLAQRAGHRTPHELVRVSTRSTGREASVALGIGRILQDQQPTVDPFTGEPSIATEPWLAPVAAAIAAGSIGAAAAAAIRSGLGQPNSAITEHALRDAAAVLCTTALSVDPDRVFRFARQARDLLDESGMADRERERYERRSLKITRLPDGSTRLLWVLDPESAAVVTDLYDRATSPRRGGPRFVDDTAAQRATSIVEDSRTTEQLASDVFAQLLRQGSDADGSQLLASGAPVVTVLVTREALTARVGHGHLEGQPDPVSIETVERIACAGATQHLALDSAGQPLDLGREERFFTRRQRRALAARDGGCRFPGCERPPSWTEAHHVQFWARDSGKTDMADGILLCKHHHLLLHNNHWEIDYREGEYWLVPPPDIDPAQVPLSMPSKSPAWRDLMRAG